VKQEKKLMENVKNKYLNENNIKEKKVGIIIK